MNDLVNGFLDDAKKRALVYVVKERSAFKQIWEIIEAYCKQFNLIISNKYTLTHNRNASANIRNPEYHIYAENPFRHANNLSNAIHAKMIKDSNVRFTMMRTLKEREDFLITYNIRNVVFLHKLQKFKHPMSANKIIKPIKLNNLLYMPPELEIIDVYHTLYDASRYRGVKEALNHEPLLFQQVIKRKEQGVFGGSCRDQKRSQLAAFKVDLVKNWLLDKNQLPGKDKFILVGSWAHDWIKSKDLCVSGEKIQVISTMTPKELNDKLQKFADETMRLPITHRKQFLQIPEDSRVTRYTFYASITSERGATEKPFLDLFTSASYEVIPYKVIDGMYIGIKEVILRFLFIDLWVIRVIRGFNTMDSNRMKQKLLYLWKLILFFRDYKIPGDTKYFGDYQDKFTSEKIRSREQSRRYFPYFPEAALIRDKKYRKL